MINVTRSWIGCDCSAFFFVFISCQMFRKIAPRPTAFPPADGYTGFIVPTLEERYQAMFDLAALLSYLKHMCE